MTIATVRNMKLHSGTPGLLAYSYGTEEEYSADYRDYWHLDDEELILDHDGEPMVLVTIRSVLTEV